MTGGSKSVLEHSQDIAIEAHRVVPMLGAVSDSSSCIASEGGSNATLDFILSHFEPPIWPRRISCTALYNGAQVLARNREQALAWFKAANYVDCRINAYPAIYVERTGSNRQAPDFIFVDIDRKHFQNYKDPQKAFNSAVSKTLKNFNEKLPGAYPTVLDTGGGYHFYQPIFAPFLLESIPEFTKLCNEPSREFLKFAEQLLSSGFADKQHTPTFRSCLLRVPGSLNSKWGNKTTTTEWNRAHRSTRLEEELTEREKQVSTASQVKIIQKWNGQRPAINYLLCDFREYLIEQKLTRYRKHQNNAKKYKQKSFVNNNANTNANTNSNSISWIESNILQGAGISDYRKVTIDLVLAKYLLNVKKYSYDTAYHIIVEWLAKCAAKRPLDFNVNYKVNNALRQAIDGPVPLPMRQDTIREKYPDMYKEIFIKGRFST